MLHGVFESPYRCKSFWCRAAFIPSFRFLPASRKCLLSPTIFSTFETFSKYVRLQHDSVLFQPQPCLYFFFPLLLMHWKIFTVDSNFSSGGLLTLSSHHLLITVCVVAGQWTQNCILFFPTTVSCTQPPSNLLLHTLAVLLKLFSWSFSKAHLNLLKSRFCLGQTYSLLPSRFYEHVVLEDKSFNLLRQKQLCSRKKITFSDEIIFRRCALWKRPRWTFRVWFSILFIRF